MEEEKKRENGVQFVPGCLGTGIMDEDKKNPPKKKKQILSRVKEKDEG